MSNRSDYVLVSPGFGAGWSTWVYGDPDAKEFAARYEPIVKFLLEGGKFEEIHKYRPNNYEDPWNDFEEPGRTVLEQYCKEFEQRYGNFPYLGGADQLKAMYHPEPAYIAEYDGSETLDPHEEADYV